MSSHKLIVKLFLEKPASITDAQAVPIFHSWIQGRELEGHLLIDVADYSHVHQAPGTLLVAHEANLILDHADGRSGLLYQRKQPFGGGTLTFEQNLLAALKHALRAAVRLESAAPGARFRTDEIQIKVADRLESPNTPATYTALDGVVAALFKQLLGSDAITLSPNPDPQAMFEITVRAPGLALTTGDLLARVEAR